MCFQAGRTRLRHQVRGGQRDQRSTHLGGANSSPARAPHWTVDGHHRLAASKMAGLKEVPVNIVDDIAGHKSTWSTVQEVVEDAATVGANNIRIKGKRVGY